jgi:hypothetical protein
MAKSKKQSAKVQKVMEEWETGKLKSGGKKVKSQAQAVAIALAQSRKKGK